ncbi:28S ribosomal protein S31, mitochondrial [Micropterus salmoides]|uniref:28S ribosomal protein S31, mitochondrial n=1 Tax=Micropterus salmoides TaxID=27706 RepID=UPI0018EA79D9|nr:28S ribosomal protein S31, mitochondrial [Micropterus salmoides]
MDSTPVSGTNVILEFTGVPLCGSSKDKCQERGRALQEAIMYRFLFRAAYTARNSSVSVYESCVLPAKCDKAAAPVFSVANGGGVKALSRSSVRLCEKKNDVASSNQDEKTNAGKEADPTETATLDAQKADDDGRVTKIAEQIEEQVALRADDGSTTQQQMDGTDQRHEQVVATPKPVRPGAAKSGKESLLDLLGAMKVEVTNKRKLKNLKVKQGYESTSKSKTAAMESTISMFQKATVEASSQSETLDPELVAAASAAASTLPNCSQAESELLRQLRQHEAITEAQKKGDVNNLGVIIADMKVGKNPNRQNARPANQIRFDEDGRGYTHDRGITAELDGVRRKRNLFSGKRLNIFSSTTEEDGVESAVSARPTLWDMDFAHQLSQLTNQRPRNGLEEMIHWTKEGKLWQYPINNEAGLEEEASVSFHEHIFLEKHLEEGFPHQGPVRHFMELVVSGLSRNPYLTVQQKREHISWFRDYFHQKEEVLKEADVYLN